MAMFAIVVVLVHWLGVACARRHQVTIHRGQGVDGLASMLVAHRTVPNRTVPATEIGRPGDGKVNLDEKEALVVAETHNRWLATLRDLEEKNEQLQAQLTKVMTKNLRRVVDGLKAYLPNLLRRRPEPDIFAEDLTVIDHRGIFVHGEDVERLLRLLQRLRKKFAVKENVTMEFNIDDPLNPFLVARWKLQVDGKKRPILFWLRRPPVLINAEIAFFFSDDYMVDYVRLNKCLVNGKPLERWPEVQLAAKPRSNFGKIKEWLRAQREIHDRYL